MADRTEPVTLAIFASSNKEYQIYTSIKQATERKYPNVKINRQLLTIREAYQDPYADYKDIQREELPDSVASVDAIILGGQYQQTAGTLRDKLREKGKNGVQIIGIFENPNHPPSEEDIAAMDDRILSGYTATTEELSDRIIEIYKKKNNI